MRRFTVRQVADLLGFSQSTIRRWIDAGSLRVERYGAGIRISQDELDRFCRAHADGSDSATAGRE